MIEKFEDFGFVTEDKQEQIDAKVQEKLGISLHNMCEALSASIQENADKISENIINMAPYGDYDKFTEDPIKMSDFLKIEAHKPENWKLNYIEMVDDSLIKFAFLCTAIDDGETFEGLVYVSKSGKIRHSFGQSTG